jgi:hypothetical protein
MSARTKRSEQTVLDVVTRVQEGLPVKAAARAAGIDPTTLWRWRKDDEALDIAIHRARTMFVARQLARIDKAGETSWKAAAWLLERRHPADFGRRVEVALDGAPKPVLDPLTGEVISASAESHSDDPALEAQTDAADTIVPARRAYIEPVGEVEPVAEDDAAGGP